MKRSVNRGNIATVFSKMRAGDTFTLPNTVTFSEAVAAAEPHGLMLTENCGLVTVHSLPKEPYRRKMPLSQLRREVTALSFSDFLSTSH